MNAHSSSQALSLVTTTPSLRHGERSAAIHAVWQFCLACLATLLLSGNVACAQNAPKTPMPPMAHKARLQLATGAAFSPDGRLWVTGLNANNQ